MQTDKVTQNLDCLEPAPEELELDAIVVGAGFAGLYALYRLRELGLSVRVVEAGDGVGGTWYWNRYPGCRCDVPTIEYSYSFDEALQQEWSWPENMSAQPEIEKYLNHVADRFRLRPDIRLGTRVTTAVFDESTNRWTVETDRGDRYSVTWCVMATGALSAPNFPDIPGLGSFAGSSVHTGLWPSEGIELKGMRVGIIGTGSSAVQAIPQIAKVAEHLTVFQRTPNYALPGRIKPLNPEFEAYVKAHYSELRKLQRTSTLGVSGFRMPSATPDRAGQAVGAGALIDLRTLNDPAVQKKIQQSFAEKVRARVNDPDVAEALIPKGFPVGCKRTVVETGYLETFNRNNVTLVDLRRGDIIEVSPSGVRTRQGDFDLDVLVLACGFDALTGALTRIDIRGRNGRLLKEAWADGPSAYLGLVAAGFPNLFMINGPGSPSVISNMVVSIEHHGDLIAETIAYMRENGLATIDASPEAEAAWGQHVDEVAAETPYTAPTCKSWYLGANVEGKARAFLPYVGGVDVYAAKCEAVMRNGFEGFVMA